MPKGLQSGITFKWRRIGRLLWPSVDRHDTASSNLCRRICSPSRKPIAIQGNNTLVHWFFLTLCLDVVQVCAVWAWQTTAYIDYSARTDVVYLMPLYYLARDSCELRQYKKQGKVMGETWKLSLNMTTPSQTIRPGLRNRSPTKVVFSRERYYAWTNRIEFAYDWASWNVIFHSVIVDFRENCPYTIDKCDCLWWYSYPVQFVKCFCSWYSFFSGLAFYATRVPGET